MKEIGCHEAPLLVVKYKGARLPFVKREGNFDLFSVDHSPQPWKISWSEFNSAGTGSGWKSGLCFPLILLIQLDQEFST